MAGAGWYKDPGDDARLRYWDGEAWTGSTIDAPATVAPAPTGPPPLPPAMAVPDQPIPAPSPVPSIAPPLIEPPSIEPPSIATATATFAAPVTPPPPPPPAAPAPSAGGGAVWAPAAQSRHVVPRRTSGITHRPAGFADRLGGLILDGVIVGIAQIPVYAATLGLLRLVAEVSRPDLSSCATVYRTSSGRLIGSGCQADNVAIVYVIFAAYVIASVWIWWRLIPGRMARRGASVGMGMARIQIEDATYGGGIGRLRALWRAILASILPLLLVLPIGLAMAVATGDGESDDVTAPLLIGLAVLALVAYTLPWLWFFWDRRHQTLYDKFSRTVVLGPDAPTEPWSVVALVVGILSLVIWILGPVAIVVGSVGIRRQDDLRIPTRGRGAARAGQVLGWIPTLLLVTIAVLVAVAIIRN